MSWTDFHTTRGVHGDNHRASPRSGAIIGPVARSVTADDDSDELSEELPPLGEERDDEPVGEVPFDIGDAEETAGDLDDELASNLDVGIEIDEPEPGEGDEPSELVLDMVELLDGADEPEDAEDNAAGPEEFDTSIGIEALPETELDASEEGVDEPMEPLLSDEPGPREAADEDAADELEFSDLAIADDPELQVAERLWSEQRWYGAGSCSAVVLASAGVVAAGDRSLLWLIEGRLERSAEAPGRIASLAVIDEERLDALYSTVRGDLVRQSRGAPAERLEAWRRAAGVTAADPTWIELVRVPGAEATVIARTSRGVLLRSTDAAQTFRTVELSGEVIARPAGADRIGLLVRDRDELRLLLSSDGGSFERIDIEGAARAAALGESPMLALAGPLVALAEPRAGVYVSTDGGRRFARVPGLIGATALEAAIWSGGPRLLVALYSESVDLASIALVDPLLHQAEIVAQVASDDGEPGDRARIMQMRYDATARRLWAAGGFGLASFQRPSD
jgi:hypothetical protein